MSEAISPISGDEAISSTSAVSWLPSSGPWMRTPATTRSFGVEAEEEERHVVALLELAAAQRALEAAAAIDALGLVQVQLPQVGPKQRVVPFEPDPRLALDEARAIGVPTTHDVSHAANHRPTLEEGPMRQSARLLRNLMQRTAGSAEPTVTLKRASWRSPSPHSPGECRRARAPGDARHPGAREVPGGTLDRDTVQREADRTSASRRRGRTAPWRPEPTAIPPRATSRCPRSSRARSRSASTSWCTSRPWTSRPGRSWGSRPCCAGGTPSTASSRRTGSSRRSRRPGPSWRSGRGCSRRPAARGRSGTRGARGCRSR